MTNEWSVRIDSESGSSLQNCSFYCNEHYIGSLQNISPSDAENIKKKMEVKDQVKK